MGRGLGENLIVLKHKIADLNYVQIIFWPITKKLQDALDRGEVKQVLASACASVRASVCEVNL